MLHCTTGNGTISAYGFGFESYRPDSESCKAKRNRQAAGLPLKRYSASAAAWNWGGPPQKSIASHAPGPNLSDPGTFMECAKYGSHGFEQSLAFSRSCGYHIRRYALSGFTIRRREFRAREMVIPICPLQRREHATVNPISRACGGAQELHYHVPNSWVGLRTALRRDSV